LQVYFAGLFCRFILQVYFAGLFCRFILQVYFADLFCRFILQVYFAGFFYVFTEHVTLQVYENLQGTGFMRDRALSVALRGTSTGNYQYRRWPGTNLSAAPCHA
jgi:hypothetical protein